MVSIIVFIIYVLIIIINSSVMTIIIRKITNNKVSNTLNYLMLIGFGSVLTQSTIFFYQYISS